MRARRVVQSLTMMIALILGWAIAIPVPAVGAGVVYDGPDTFRPADVCLNATGAGELGAVGCGFEYHYDDHAGLSRANVRADGYSYATQPTLLDRARAARDQAGLKPDGTPNRDSPAYVGGYSSDGSVLGTGNVGTGPSAIHAEDVIQNAMPGATMTEPYAWRRNPETLELEWQPFTVCPRCQSRYPEELFEPGTTGAPGGAWDD